MVHVDDLVVSAEGKAKIEKFVRGLSGLFVIKDLGKASYHIRGVPHQA